MAQAYTIAPLHNPLDKTTKHLTRLTNYISQVIANPAFGRGSQVGWATCLPTLNQFTNYRVGK